MTAPTAWLSPARLLDRHIPVPSDAYKLLVLKVYLAVPKCIVFDARSNLARGMFFKLRGRRGSQFDEFLTGSAIWGEFVRKRTSTTIVRVNEIAPPAAGHLILLNHVNEIDFAFDCLVIRRPFFANQQIKSSFFAYWWMKAMGSQVFDYRQPKSIADSMRSLLRLLDTTSYIVYPEGGNSYSEEIRPLKKGMIRLAYENGIPVYVVLKSGLSKFQLGSSDRSIGYKACGTVSPSDFGGWEPFHARIQELMTSEKRALDLLLEGRGSGARGNPAGGSTLES